ncbi:alpha/beta fold hydrolase [Agromyces silvae]|uniref:alpha/beta fold hydrolase n=1 Tax=Agromyces silvae TaxID=3388266 RepID=UPI00280B5751|nr:alpha/beta hydrolase [Agromyces protaetiae]
MPLLAVPGAELAYDADGPVSAPALVLLHSGVATMRMWDPQIEALSAAHRVVRLDLRGFGATTHEDVPYSNRADVRAVMDHLAVPSATLVGAGRGATIALDLALESPDRVDGVVLVGGGPSGFVTSALTEEEHRRFDELDAAAESGDRHALIRLETALWAAGSLRLESDLDRDFVAFAHELAAANAAQPDGVGTPEPLQPPAVDRLADLGVPALVMVGEYDLSPARAQYARLLEALPDATGFCFQDAAHLPNLEHPGEFTHVLLDWLTERAL